MINPAVLSMTPEERVLRARIRLQRKAMFIYSILFYATYRIADDRERAPIHTAFADALGNIVVFPEYIKNKNDDYIAMILYHEAVHLVLKHPLLCKGRIRMLWNIAADIKANQYCAEAKYEIPKTWIHNEAFFPGSTQYEITINGKKYTIQDYANKSAIRIYDELYDMLDKDNQITHIKLSGRFGDNCPGDGGQGQEHPAHFLWGEMTAEQREAIEDIVNDRIRRAYVSSKMRGDLPAGLGRLIGDILEAKMGWKSMLRSMITAVMPHEPSYDKPHKRTYACRYYIPHIKKENVDVIVSIDTSGSVSQDDLTLFLSEIVGMARQCHSINMTIIVCDAEIHTVLPVRNGSIKTIMGLEIKGGGGTSHLPVYAWCDKNMGNASLLINFTDGYTCFPKKTKIPTLWVVNSQGADKEHFPFGKVAKMV